MFRSLGDHSSPVIFLLDLIHFKDPYNPDEVGAEGCGYVWKKEVDSDDESDKEFADLWGNRHYLSELWYLSIRGKFKQINGLSSLPLKGHSDEILSEEESSEESLRAATPPPSPPPEDTKCRNINC